MGQSIEGGRESHRPKTFKELFPGVDVPRVRGLRVSPQFIAVMAIINSQTDLNSRERAGENVESLQTKLALFKKEAVRALKDKLRNQNYTVQEIEAARMTALGVVTLPESRF